MAVAVRLQEMNTNHVWRRKRDLSRKVTEERNSDFRRRTSAESGGRRLRWPYGARVVASRGLELEVTIRGSGTLAASADDWRLGGTPRPTEGSDRSVASPSRGLVWNGIFLKSQREESGG